MNRTTFGPWGLELSPEDFACALAALGVGQARFNGLAVLRTEYNADELEKVLRSATSQATKKPVAPKPIPRMLFERACQGLVDAAGPTWAALVKRLADQCRYHPRHRQEDATPARAIDLRPGCAA